MKIGQAFIEICEATANVPFITQEVQREFGDDYTLVSTEGLEFPDSHGTKGLLQNPLKNKNATFSHKYFYY